MNKETTAVLSAYCAGANKAITDSGVPFEFKLVGYSPDPWTPEDIVLMSRIIGFIGLTQSQGEMEKGIIQMIRKGVSVEHGHRRRSLGPPLLTVLYFGYTPMGELWVQNAQTIVDGRPLPNGRNLRSRCAVDTDVV